MLPDSMKIRFFEYPSITQLSILDYVKFDNSIVDNIYNLEIFCPESPPIFIRKRVGNNVPETGVQIIFVRIKLHQIPFYFFACPNIYRNVYPTIWTQVS